MLAIIVTLCSISHPHDCIRDAVPARTLTECIMAPGIEAYVADHYAGSGLRVTRWECEAGRRT